MGKGNQILVHWARKKLLCNDSSKIKPVYHNVIKLLPTVIVEQQLQTSAPTQQSMASSVASVSSKPPPPLPEEHRVLQDVFSQLVQLCTARASHNPVSVLHCITVIT